MTGSAPVQVRAEREGDGPGIGAVHRRAFPTDAEARLVHALRGAGHLAVSMVATRAGVLIGHVAFSPVRLVGPSRLAGDETGPAGGLDGLGLAPVAVLPGHRRQGVGERLVRAGISRCGELGTGFVVVLGDPGYYRRFGFEPAAGRGLRDEYGGGEAFQVLELTPGAVPAQGGLVRYGPEFADLDGS